MFRNSKSFLDRITNMMSSDNDVEEEEDKEEASWMGEETTEGQLTIDMYQTASEIVIEAMVAGVNPDDLHISINREMVTIKGSRESSREVLKDDYFYKELYWGTFSRTIVLPEEIDVETAEATEHGGLLTIRLPKIDREKTQQLKVKSK